MRINNKIFKKLSLLLSFLLFSACSTNTYKISHEEFNTKKQHLEKLLLSLSPDVLEQEASLLAEVAINYSLILAEEYQTVSNPIFQNILVNSGFKERGLCIHWTEDLLRKLSSLNLQSLKFHWGVANREDKFKLEHSAVVVSSIEGSFEQGIILDPWRHSGYLYFILVKKDRYPWVKQYNKITEDILFL